jgi:hypothetical protein
MSDESDSSSSSSSDSNTDALSESRTSANSREFSEVKKSGSKDGGEGPSASEVGAGHVPFDMQSSSSESSEGDSSSSDGG